MARSTRITKRLIVFATTLLLAIPAVAAEPASRVESLLTKDTAGFLHVRVGDVWGSPNMAFYRKVLGSLSAEESRAASSKFLPAISQIESVTIIAPSMQIETPTPDGFPTGESLLFVFTTKKPIERNELLKALGFDARVKAHRGTDYLFEESYWAGLLLLDPTTIVIGTEDSIVRVIEQREAAQGAESGLAKIFARESGKHAATIAVNPAVLATPDIARGVPPPFAGLLKATGAWAALDMKEHNQLSLALDFSDTEEATAAKKALESLRDLVSLQLKGLQKTLEATEAEAKRPNVTLLDFPTAISPILAKAGLKYLDATVNGISFQVKDNGVHTSINLTEFFPPNADALAVMGFALLMQSMEYRAYWATPPSLYDREEVPYYLRQNFDRIAAALEAYHQDKGSYPPAALCDKDGKPLLSWRVLILPYLEQRQGDLQPAGRNPRFEPVQGKVPLGFPMKGGNEPKKSFADVYKKFKLDEPWNSLNNKKMIEQMPRVFQQTFTVNDGRSPSSMRQNWKTGFQVFTGAGSLFPAKNGISKGQVKDGLDSTVAVIFRDDSREAVAWTKPLDIPFSAEKRLPKLCRSRSEVGNISSSRPQEEPSVYVLFADGKSRRIPGDFDEKNFRGLITIAGGENVKLPEWKPKEPPNSKTPSGIPGPPGGFQSPGQKK